MGARGRGLAGVVGSCYYAGMLTDNHGAITGLTLRSLLVGATLVAFVNVAGPHSLFILHSSLLATGYLPAGIVFPFFVFVLFLNAPLRKVRPEWALSQTELIVVFVMGWVGSTVPTWGVTGYLISVPAAAHYFASPENQWAMYFHRFVPGWIAPQDVEAMRWFFNGLPEGSTIPWAPWVVPGIWWVLFVAAMSAASVAVMVILRKQWIERERLVFPLVAVPQELIGPADSRDAVPPMLKNRLFWIGASIPLFIITWNMVQHFAPALPAFGLSGGSGWTFGRINIGRGFISVPIGISFPVTGFAFLINLDVSFSIWFMALAYVIEIGIFNRVGYSIGRADIYGCADAATSWQSFGALSVWVGIGLYTARHHLRDVWRKVRDPSCGVDDSQELMSYRTAAITLVLSTAYMCFWMRESGMQWLVIALYMLATFVLYVGVTKIVVESGILFARGPLVAQSFAAYVLGSAHIAGPCMTALAFSYAWHHELKNFFMPAAVHCDKLTDSYQLRRRSLLAAMVLALVVAFGVSAWYILLAGYERGAYNFGRWIFGRGATIPYDTIVGKLRNPLTTDWNRMLFFGVGGVVMALCVLMRFRFAWWPVSPLALPVAAMWVVRLTCFSVFVAWLSKVVILRIGGIRLYRRCCPFFLGLAVGYFLGIGLGYSVDFVWFPEAGHSIYGM